MPWTVRPFEPRDYDAFVEVRNAAYSGVLPPICARELRYCDEHRDRKIRQQRWVAEQGGQVVGGASYGQFVGSLHPRKFWIQGIVHPDWQRRGIGAALYEHVLAALGRFDPLLVRHLTRSDLTQSVCFLTRRGFREDRRYVQFHLDVGRFDASAWPEAIERVAASGAKIKTLAELAGDANRDRKLHELYNQVHLDQPQLDESTPFEFRWFIDNVINHPMTIPQAYFVAVAGERYVGQSNVTASASGDELDTELTGVSRDFRRKGIATALKLAGIRYAAQRGCKLIRGGCEINNAGMIAVHERLGYRRQPDWVDYVKVIDNGSGRQPGSA